MVDPEFFSRRKNSRKPSVSKLDSSVVSSQKASSTNLNDLVSNEVPSSSNDQNLDDVPFKANSLYSATPVNYQTNARPMTQLQSFDMRQR